MEHQTIHVHATAHVDTLQTLLSELPQAFVDILPDQYGIAVSHLNAQSPEYLSVFSGQTSRARTSNRGDIYLDTDTIHGLVSLRAVLFHELAHAVQFVLRRPLRFAAWTWLHDLGFWDDRARSLLQIITDQSGLKQIIPRESPWYRPAARRLMNFFADADAHAFLLDHGVVDLVSYGEALKDYLVGLRASSHRSASSPLHQLWREHQQIPQRLLRIAAQSWPVFMEWLTIVGGRWARVGTLIGRPDARAILDGYVGPDREAIREYLGEFADDRVFDMRWRELADAGDDSAALWEGIHNLATDAVVLVRSVCDR